MGLRFILGAASSGKTDFVLNEITKALDGDRNIIYIVPEQFTMQSEMDLILYSGKRCVIKAEVLSFNRLAYRVQGELGIANNKTIDNIGKNMLIRKLAIDMGREFKYYGTSVNKHGFIEEIGKLITEFYQYGTSPDLLHEIAEKPQINKSLSDKLTDIVNIYELYANYLTDNSITAEDSLDYLAAVIKDSKFVIDSLVWIDGFFGFTQQELNIIAALLEAAREVTIALTINENKAYQSKPLDSDIFGETKQTARTLCALASERKARKIKPVFLFKPSISRLTHLRNNLCGLKPVVCDINSKEINISFHANIYEETEYAAELITYLTRDNGLRYRDIALISADISLYERIIKGIFARYDIPVFIDAKEDILTHPLTEFIRAIAGIVYKNWSYEAVFRLIKTYILAIDKFELYDFENYCIEYGISGYRWRYDEWTAGMSGGRYDKDVINNIKDIIKNALEPFTQGLKPDSALSVREFSARIFAVLDKVNIGEIIAAWINRAYERRDNLLLLKHRQIWGLIRHIFDEIVSVMGDLIVTAKEFSAILDSGIVSADMGLVPPGLDQVLAGDISRSRLPSVKALIIIGLSDGALNPMENAALLDMERKTVQENGARLSDGYKQKMMRQELYIYSLCAKPSDYLFVSCALSGLDGKVIYPAPIIDKLQAMYPACTDRFLPKDFIKTKEAALKDAGMILFNIKNNIDITDTSLGIIDFYRNDPEYKHIFDNMAALSLGEKIQERLSAETVERLYGLEIITSVSRLENYIQCPFSYFVKYNLKAAERAVYKVDYVDIGNLFHAILEEFSKLMTLHKISWKELNEQTISKFVDLSMEIIKDNDQRQLLGATAANRYLCRRFTRIAEKSIWALCEHIKLGDFYPAAAELSFKSQPITGITIDSGNKKFILTGKIDRVDITDLEGKQFVKIIDYKTGAEKFSFTDVYYGMQLQLLLYLDYFIKSSKEKPRILPGGVFYFNIGDPILNADELNDISELNARILSKFKMSGLMAADMDAARAIDKTFEQAGGRSAVVGNVQLSGNTETGFTKASSVATLDEFALLQEYANTKALEAGRGILRGRIDRRPYKKGMRTACDYCDFSGICKFDLVNETMKYRSFKGIKTAGEIISG